MDMLRIFTGGAYAAGTLAYFANGAYAAVVAAKDTPEEEEFDWLKTGLTVVPGVVGAFIAGYNLEPDTAADFIFLAVSGWGLADLAHRGDKALGVESFMRKKIKTMMK